MTLSPTDAIFRIHVVINIIQLDSDSTIRLITQHQANLRSISLNVTRILKSNSEVQRERKDAEQQVYYWVAVIPSENIQL